MIVIYNFGGQFAHLIARRVRELGCYSEIVPYDTGVEKLRKLQPDAVIFSGGPNNLSDDTALVPPAGILELGIPILGICYGHQLLAHMLKGKVVPGNKREYGKETLSVANAKGLLKGLSKQETVWFSHGDTVETLPDGFHGSAQTHNCPLAVIENPKKRFYGVQFHPEVVHTVHGMKVLENFLDLAKAQRDWKVENLAQRLKEEARKEIGNAGVLMAVSGGVDSLVTAQLLHHAVGKQLFVVFIDPGLMRQDEVEGIRIYYEKAGFEHFEIVDARKEFLGALKGVTDPEEKRKRIGHTFIEVFEKKARQLKEKAHVTYLAQGTIYPDRIESAQPSKAASKIKSHHNLTLPEKMDLKIVEPLKELYKDEVRVLGKQLGLPKDRLDRHPFPGPGLAIRILGEVTEERLRIVREADAIFIEELHKTGQYDKVWQAFAALLPVKAVGVMGDARTYDYIIALRAITSRDGMTADWAKLPYEVLEKISSRIVNEVKGANRVLYDVSQKPPATIEYE